MFRFLWRLLFGVPCAHQWEKVAEHAEPSPFSRVSEIGECHLPSWFFTGTYVVILKCLKCGAIHTNRNEI